MERWIEALRRINAAVSGVVWGPPMLLLLMGTGVFLTFRLGFLPLTRMPLILRHTLGSLLGRKGRKAAGAGLTPFQAVSTALASTVGTGSVAGVTGAIFVGGPGAVFWMWVSAFFGMATKYTEILLAVRYRRTAPDGSHYGGPMYYMAQGLGMRRMAGVFALLGGLASFGIGNIAQSTEIANCLADLLGRSGISVSRLAIGAGTALVVAAVTLGGAKRIGQVTGLLVPFMALFYLLAGLAVAVLRIREIPAALSLILRSAFSARAAAGGAAGYAVSSAIRQGVARGVFSNEAGLGSAPIAHAAADTDSPVRQGFWGIFEVFVDTMVICTITALTVILSGVYREGAIGQAYPSAGVAASAAFQAVLPGSLGGIALQISLLFFALSTLLGWSYYGERSFAYLSGGSGAVTLLYRVIFCLVCVFGAAGAGELMWELSDTLNAMMAIPNLIALLLLSAAAVRLTREELGPIRRPRRHSPRPRRF